MNAILLGDALAVLKILPDGSVQTCVTSPPYYGLRDYGVDGQIGLEESPEAFTRKLVEVFREVRRVLRDDGTLWLNLGDSYVGTGDKGDYRDPKYKEGRNGQAISKNKTVEGLKRKDLIGIPWRVAFALQADGWYLRQDIIWHKPNPMPESVQDRCTKAHEYIFLLSKSERYYFDHERIKEPSIYHGKDARSDKGNIRYGGKRDTGNSLNGQQSFVTINETRNKRSVWTVTTKPYKGAHFATFPPDLIKPCILAGAPPNGVVLDPFTGSGTTLEVAKNFGRRYIGIELNPEYLKLAEERIRALPECLPFTGAKETANGPV